AAADGHGRRVQAMLDRIGVDFGKTSAHFLGQAVEAERIDIGPAGNAEGGGKPSGGGGGHEKRIFLGGQVQFHARPEELVGGAPVAVFAGDDGGGIQGIHVGLAVKGGG